MNKKNKIIISILAIFIIIGIIMACFVADFVLSNREYYKNEKNIDIPIFVYHDISYEQTNEEYMQTIKGNFEKQIEGLRKLGYKIITYDDLIAYNNGEKKLPQKSLILTFDDGWVGNYTVLFPIVKEYNIPIAINVIDNKVGEEGYLNWEQIKEMSDSGLVYIYSHGKEHIESYKIETEQFVDDIEYAHSNIEKNIGKNVTKVYTYPYGLYEEEKIEALAKAGFVQNLTDNKVNNSKELDLNRLHREYPLNDPVWKILLKTVYRSIRY